MNVKNTDYLSKHYNEYIYPKPINDIDEEFIKKNKYYLNDPTYFWHKLWPEKKYNSEKLNVLIAGCGSQQAAILSKCNPNHLFTGIDLSKNSIAHEQRLVEKHQILNLKLICDDFRKIKFKEKFNLIISSGVIHHLDDPGSALEYFADNLLDDGVISLMVYGNNSSYPINQIKKIIDPLKLDHNEESINCIKKLFERINPNHPAYFFAKNFTDFDNKAGIVDMFLHKSEKFFSIKELVDLLSKYDLKIKNLSDGKNLSSTKFFINNIEKLKFLRKLKIEEQWQIGQILNWDDRKIEINCSKKNYLFENDLTNNQNIDDYYLCISPETSYEIKEDTFNIADTNGESYNYNFRFTVESSKVLELVLNGKEKVTNLLRLYNDQEKNLLRDFLIFLLENGLVDKSLHLVRPFKI